MGIEIETYPSGYLQTNAYLLTDSDRGEAVLIDAPHFVLKDIQPSLDKSGCSLVGLLLTHGHYDHIGDAAKISSSGIPLYGHLDDKALFEEPERMLPYAYPPDIQLDAFQIDHWVSEGDALQILGQSCEVRHVPGHCPGNVLFYFKELNSAFVGDALFAGSIGRTDLPGGSFADLEKSIRERIYTLPAATVVLPGHGPTTTVGIERSTNPHVAGE